MQLNTDPDKIDRIASDLAAMPEVRFVGVAMGDYDILVGDPTGDYGAANPSYIIAFSPPEASSSTIATTVPLMEVTVTAYWVSLERPPTASGSMRSPAPGVRVRFCVVTQTVRSSRGCPRS